MRVLIVEDNRATWESLRVLLEVISKWPAEYDNATNMNDALALAAEHNYDLITMDGRLSPGSGPTVVETLRARGCKAKIVMYCHHENDLARGLELGADAGFLKGSDPEKLIALLKSFNFA